MSLESTSSRCEQIAQQLMIHKRHIPPQEIIDKVNAVTRESLIEAAQRVIATPSTFTTIGPGKELQWG